MSGLDGMDDWEFWEDDSEGNESDDEPIPYQLTQAGRDHLDGK